MSEQKDSSKFKAAKRQAMPFMFEIIDSPVNMGGKTWQMLLPYNPENYQMTYQPRVNFTMTQGGAFEDNIGIATPKFSIAGVIGVQGTTEKGSAKSLERNLLTGLELYHDMESNLLGFYEQFGTRSMDDTENKEIPAKRPKLKFYNFCDQEFWEVQINQFTLVRNTQRRFLYQYNIQMTGLKRIGGITDSDLVEAQLIAKMDRDYKQKKIDDAKAKELADKMSAWDKFMKNVGDITKKITGWSQQAMALVGKVQGEVTKLKGFMTQIATASANFKNGVTSMVNLPMDVIKTAKKTTDSILKDIGDLHKIAGTGVPPRQMVIDLRETKRLLMSFEKTPQYFTPQITNSVTKGTTTTPTFGQKPIVNATVQPQTGAIKTTPVRDNDTIYTIASRNNTDWRKIVSANKLEYPFIATKPTTEYLYSKPLTTATLSTTVPAGSTTITMTGVPATATIVVIGGEKVGIDRIDGDTVHLQSPTLRAHTAGGEITAHERKLSVMKVGDKIAIPSNEPWTANIGTAGNHTREERLFGIDEQLDEYGEMVSEFPDTEFVDVATIGGVANIEMQLKHRLMTMRGELAELGHPEYGSLIPTFIGKINTDVWYERILLECRMSVLDDPRVAYLTNVQLLTESTAVYFRADVHLNMEENPVGVNILLS